MCRWIGVILMVTCLPLSLSAEGFWVKKDFAEWSARECAKLLNDSPWARSQTITEIFIEEIGDNPGSVPSREHIPQITYIAQIWSAEPIAGSPGKGLGRNQGPSRSRQRSLRMGSKRPVHGLTGRVHMNCGWSHSQGMAPAHCIETRRSLGSGLETGHRTDSR